MNAIMTITTEVARIRRVSVADILSERRTQTIIRPRHEAMYLARQMTPASLPAIGRRLGGRDHTTVLHAVRSVDERIRTVAGYGDELEGIRAVIQPKLPGQGRFELVSIHDVDAEEAALRIERALAAGEAVAVFADEIAAIIQQMRGFEAKIASLEDQVSALKREAIAPRPVALTINASAPLTGAVKALVAAHDALEGARFSGRERFVQQAFDRALKTLKSTLETEGQPS